MTFEQRKHMESLKDQLDTPGANPYPYLLQFAVQSGALQQQESEMEYERRTR